MQNQAIEKKSKKKEKRKKVCIFVKPKLYFFNFRVGRGHLIPYYHGTVTSALYIYMYKFSKSKSKKKIVREKLWIFSNILWSLDVFHRAQRGSIKSGSSSSSSTILLPMQEKASIINALIKSSSDGYHLGLTSFWECMYCILSFFFYMHKATPHLKETLFMDSPSTLLVSTHVCWMMKLFWIFHFYSKRYIHPFWPNT